MKRPVCSAVRSFLRAGFAGAGVKTHHCTSTLLPPPPLSTTQLPSPPPEANQHYQAGE